MGEEGARPRPRTLPRKQASRTLAVPPPPTSPYLPAPHPCSPGERSCHSYRQRTTGRKKLPSQCLSLAPALPIVLGQIQAPVSPMSTKGKAKINQWTPVTMATLVTHKLHCCLSVFILKIGLSLSHPYPPPRNNPGLASTRPHPSMPPTALDSGGCGGGQPLPALPLETETLFSS